LQTRRGLQVDPLVRVALVDSNLEGYAVFVPGSAGTSATVSTSFDVSSSPNVGQHILRTAQLKIAVWALT